MSVPTDVKRSFFNRASIGGHDVCWNWQGAKSGGDYGVIRRKNRTYLAHRVALHIARPGLLSDEQQVHHVCQNPACVNPAHLMAVTQYEHGQEHRPEFCKRGHPLTPENSKIKGPGWRECRICGREAKALRQRERYAADSEYRERRLAANRASRRRLRGDG